MAPSPRDHLLPKSATPLERALSAAAAGQLEQPHNVVRDAWDPDRCPVHLLPYLAAAWSVDEWDPAWSEAEKRQAIRDSVWLHKHKGTIGALKRALAQVRLAVTVSEWFQHGGAPYTFRLRVALADGAGWTGEQCRRLIRIAIGAKNVRSWLDALTIVPPPEPVSVRAGIAIRTRIRIVNLIETSPLVTSRAPLHAGVGVRMVIRVRGAASS